MMWNLKRNALCAAGLVMLAVGVGCTGFFVSPTLTSLQIGPQDQTITANPVQTLQMSATGTFSDGSTQDLTGKVLWTSETATCATINSGGLVTPVKTVNGICTSTISAADGTITPVTTTVTVSEGMPTSINLTVSNPNPTAGMAITFMAKAIFPGSNTPQDITSSVTWIVSDTTNVPLADGSGNVTIPLGAPVEQVTVQASFDNVVSNVVTISIQ
jgi:trimeric autotransporter adhesin